MTPGQRQQHFVANHGPEQIHAHGIDDAEKCFGSVHDNVAPIVKHDLKGHEWGAMWQACQNFGPKGRFPESCLDRDVGVQLLQRLEVHFDPLPQLHQPVVPDQQGQQGQGDDCVEKLQPVIHRRPWFALPEDELALHH